MNRLAADEYGARRQSTLISKGTVKYSKQEEEEEEVKKEKWDHQILMRPIRS